MQAFLMEFFIIQIFILPNWLNYFIPANDIHYGSKTVLNKFHQIQF